MAYQAPRRFVMWGALVCIAGVLGLMARAALFGGVAYITTTDGSSNGGDVLCDGLPPFVVVVDAGSTGCRAHAFKVTPGTVAPAFTLEPAGARVKLETPLASLAGKSEGEVSDAIVPMLEEIAARVPAKDVPNTPVYVWATAGARALSETQQQTLWSTVTNVVRTQTQFKLPNTADSFQSSEENHFRTIAGEEEGFFAWLAANYVSGVDVTAVGTSDAPRSEETVGALDVGGGSAQIVSLLAQGNGGQSGNENSIGSSSLDELAKNVYVKSYLGVGAAHAERRARTEAAADALKNYKKETTFPCGFKGEVEEVDGVTMTGTGEYDACVELIQRLTATKMKEDGAKSVATSEYNLRAPDSALLPINKKFLGMSLLFHATHFLHVAFPGSLDSFPEPSLAEIGDAGRKACATEWERIQRDVDGVDENTPTDRLPGRCFDTALIQALLGTETGFGFGDDEQRISFVDDVDGKGVEWTMGAALSLAHRAAQHSVGVETTLACAASSSGGSSTYKKKVAVGIGAKSRTGRTIRRWVGFLCAAGALIALVAALAGAVEADKMWRLTKPAERIMGPGGIAMRKRGSLSNF